MREFRGVRRHAERRWLTALTGLVMVIGAVYTLSRGAIAAAESTTTTEYVGVTAQRSVNLEAFGGLFVLVIVFAALVLYRRHRA